MNTQVYYKQCKQSHNKYNKLHQLNRAAIRSCLYNNATPHTVAISSRLVMLVHDHLHTKTKTNSDITAHVMAWGDRDFSTAALPRMFLLIVEFGIVCDDGHRTIWSTPWRGAISSCRAELDRKLQ